MSEANRSDKIVIDAVFSEYTFPNFLDPIKERAREFEELHPEYRIEIGSFYFQNLGEEVSKAALAGRPPTIASYYSGASQLARDTLTADGRPLFTTVEKAIGGRDEILGHPVVIDDIVTACRDFYTIDGSFAAMPLTLSTMHMYTNTTLLRAAGVREVPRTWQGIEAACAAVAELVDGPSHGISWANDGKFFQQAMAQLGGRLTDAANGRTGRATSIDLASPEMMSYVTWWHRMHRDGHYLYTGQVEDWAGSFKAFAEQQVVFRLSSSFDAAYMVRAGQEGGFGVEVTPTPYNGDLPLAGNWIGGDGIWLADGLDKATEDGALAFMQYLSSPRAVAEWHKVYGSSPTTYASVARLEREGWFDGHPHHRVAIEQLDSTNGTPGASGAILGHFAQIQHRMMDAMEDVMGRGAEPVARFTEVAAEAARLLDDYGSFCLATGPRPAHCLLIDS
ncbi:extracellular solute-binding protein [Sphaerisporangium corydalis]|uniref:Extracellular solute-binding protein n=1 Tax=Sphaerisporangium corydalis TaxID=1441875 RepID=A0ABV9EAY3_9ACTN|nr:extracellular solute-binding protein [Sphaerisporangium corydalis]